MPRARQASGGTGRGSALSAPTPSASARRGAGSIVHTRVRLPSRAASAPRAAAVVVLPTPPGPTQTRILLSRTRARIMWRGRLSHSHEQRGDVVGTARLVRGVDEQLAGRLELVGRPDDRRHLLIGDRSPQAVAAQEVDVALLHGAHVEPGLHVLLVAETAGDHVAV